MKVLVLHNRYRSAVPSGENRVVDDEIDVLRDAGVDVVPVIEESDSLADAGPRTLANAAMGPVYSPSGVRRFRRILHEERPDIVHIHNVYPLLSPWVVRTAHGAGVPVVQTVHNHRHACVNGLFYRDGHQCNDCLGRRFAFPAIAHGCYRGSRLASASMVSGQIVHRQTWRSVDRFIALTPYIERFLLAVGIPRERISVRPNPVSDPGPSAAPGDDVLYVGRLERTKGIELLLDAWRLANPARHLRIAGDGPLYPDVRERASLDCRIHATGRATAAEVADQMRRCGLVVVPSLSEEAFPRVIVEAFSHGRAVAASATQSLRAVITDATGWLLLPDPRAWAEFLTGLTPEDLVTKGAKARATYAEKYTPATSVERLLTIYADVLSSRPMRSR